MRCLSGDTVHIKTIGSGQGIGDHIGLALEIPYVRGKFRDTRQLISLSGGEGLAFLVQTGYQGLLIRVDREVATLDHVSEVTHRLEYP